MASLPRIIGDLRRAFRVYNKTKGFPQAPVPTDSFKDRNRVEVRILEKEVIFELEDDEEVEGYAVCEDIEEEDAQIILLDDARIHIIYDSVQDLWIIGYYPISDVGFEVASRTLSKAVEKTVECLERHKKFLQGDVEGCAEGLEEEVEDYLNDTGKDW